MQQGQRGHRACTKMQQNAAGNRPALHATHAGTGRHHNNDAKHRNMLQIRSLCLAHSACAESVTQCTTSTRFKVIAGDAFVSPLKQELIPKMPPKGNRKARQGKARMWRKKEHTHTHTQIESKQEGAAAVKSDVRSTLRQSLLRLTLSLLFSLFLFHSSLDTALQALSPTHTHSRTGEERKGRKKRKQKNVAYFFERVA